MIQQKFALLFAAFALILAPPIQAETSEQDFVQIRKEAPVTIKPDKAYFLIRAPKAKNSLMLLRVPSEEDLAEYEQAKRAEYEKKDRDESFEEFTFDWEDKTNLYELRVTHHYARPEKDMRIALAEAPPGDYIYYGIGFAGYLYQCHCMGTVGFTAEPGKITDLGTSLITAAWEPSPYRELEEEANLGRVARMDFGLFAATIRPSRDTDTVPQQLANAVIEPAKFHAVGPWLDPRRTHANRLGAVPGILEYREGITYDPVKDMLLRLPE